MENTGFLDYRIPVCSDLPMIDTVIVEEPNPRHPYGVRGIGETPIIPPMAAVANAVSRATGVRFAELAGGRALIGDDMGVGKTIQALSYAALHPENLSLIHI